MGSRRILKPTITQIVCVLGLSYLPTGFRE